MTSRRKTVAFFPKYERHLSEGMETHMLREDADHRVMPFGHESQNWPDYRVTVEPYSEAAKECLEVALSLEEREYHLTPALAKFVRRAVSLILYEGEAFFELVFDSDDEPKGFLLGALPPGRVELYEGIVTQYLPHEVQRGLRLAQPFIEIPERNVLHFTFPKSLGGKEAILNQKAELQRLGNSVMPRFAEGDFIGVSREFGFNVGDAYRELRDVAFGRATARLGWNGRFRLDEKVTEFYKMYRLLKFAVSLAHVREHVIRCLNEFIEPVMKRVGLTGSVVVSGLPSAKDMDGKLEDLVAGDLSFKDALHFSYVL